MGCALAMVLHCIGWSQSSGSSRQTRVSGPPRIISSRPNTWLTPPFPAYRPISRYPRCTASYLLHRCSPSRGPQAAVRHPIPQESGRRPGGGGVPSTVISRGVRCSPLFTAFTRVDPQRVATPRPSLSSQSFFPFLPLRPRGSQAWVVPSLISSPLLSSAFDFILFLFSCYSVPLPSLSFFFFFFFLVYSPLTSGIVVRARCPTIPNHSDPIILSTSAPVSFLVTESPSAGCTLAAPPHTVVGAPHSVVIRGLFWGGVLRSRQPVARWGGVSFASRSWRRLGLRIRGTR